MLDTVTASPVFLSRCSPSFVSIVFFVFRLCQVVLCICSCDSPWWIAVPVLLLTAFGFVLAFMPVFRLVWAASFLFVVSVCFGGEPTFVGLVCWQVPLLGLPAFAVTLEQCLFVSSVVWRFDWFVFRFVYLFDCSVLLVWAEFDSLVKFDALVHPRLGRIAVLWRISLYVWRALYSPYRGPGQSP